MKALVFDLDGTLVDTKYDMLDAGNLVFENQGWVTRLEGFSGLQTAIQGGRAILRYGLQEEGITFNDKLLTEYYQLYLNIVLALSFTISSMRKSGRFYYFVKIFFLRSRKVQFRATNHQFMDLLYKI